MNSDEEIHFLVDEELLELESIVKEVQFRLKNPDLEKNQLILNAFIKSCIRTLRKPKPIPIPIPSLPTPTPEKKEKFKTIKEIKKIPKKKRVFPVPIPGGNHLEKFKTKTKYKKQEIETKLPKSRIPLIQDNVTNKPLAVADIDDRYIIREPPITQDQIKILKQVIEQRPADPKQAWRLLKNSAANLTDEQLTNIKYYMVNSLFALGRLEPLLHDKEITDITCDGVGYYIRIKRDGRKIKTNIIFKDKEDLSIFLQKLAKKLNKPLDEKNNIIDTVHRHHRFHITLGLHGASSKFTIKKIE